MKSKLLFVPLALAALALMARPGRAGDGAIQTVSYPLIFYYMDRTTPIPLGNVAVTFDALPTGTVSAKIIGGMATVNVSAVHTPPPLPSGTEVLATVKVVATIGGNSYTTENAMITKSGPNAFNVPIQAPPQENVPPDNLSPVPVTDGGANSSITP